MKNPLRPFFVLVASVLVLNGCIGGGSTPEPNPDPRPPASVSTWIGPAPRESGGDVFDDLLRAEEERLERVADDPDRGADNGFSDPSPFADPSPGRAPLVQRRQRLIQLARRPDPRALTELRTILRDRMDMLSALAALALGRLGGAHAENALEQALSDPRVHVRQSALSGLVQMRSSKAAEHCRTMLLGERMIPVRASAAVGLGVLRDADSVSLLVRVMSREAPVVRFSAAWSLARLGDRRGYVFLEELAASGDLQAAPQAMLTLGSLRDRRAVPALYRGLLEPREKTWRAALAGLKLVPPRELAAGLELLPAAAREPARIRRELLECLAEGGRAPVESFALVSRGTPEERVLALRCLASGGSIDAVPVAINALDDPTPRVQVTAAETLEQLMERHKLPKPERGRADYKRWWLDRYRVLAATRTEALLMTPATTRLRVRVGTRLDWDATVIGIAPGKGPNQRVGARVRLQLGSRTVDLVAVDG